MKNSFLLVSLVVASLCCLTASAVEQTPGVSPGAGVRYATDAYPGFDNENEIVNPSRKEPRWFSFIFGPDRQSAREQLAYCRDLLGASNWSKACSQLDALVREWPTSAEAPIAQRLLADTRLNQLLDTEQAFADYRYLLDFYSLQCEYDKVADLLYKVAGLLKAEGKEVMFVRFENTVDVRRAFEACVLHAPGAKWVPEALLIIASLREREEKFAEAVKVYENLRNLHPDSEEARISVVRESSVRMKLLSDYGYNRSRCQDTMDFLKQALKSCRQEDLAEIQEMQEKVRLQCEESDYQGAKFYDSPTRTVRSAITAYEKFLLEHPAGKYSELVRARIEVLKGALK